MFRWKNSWICHSLPVSCMVKRGRIQTWFMSVWILYCTESLSRTCKVSHKALLYYFSQKSNKFRDCFVAWGRFSHHLISEGNPPISGGLLQFSLAYICTCVCYNHPYAHPTERSRAFSYKGTFCPVIGRHQHTMCMGNAEWTGGFVWIIFAFWGIKLLYADYDFCCYLWIVFHVRGNLPVSASTDNG